MTQQHTQEPWKVIEFYMAGNRIGIEPETGPMIGFFHYKSKSAEANARRIVAAVNACAGISTDSLEQGGVGSLLSLGLEEQKRGDAAQQQRDDLQARLHETDARNIRLIDQAIKCETKIDSAATEVEQIALALDAMFSHERGLDIYIDALNKIVRDLKGGSQCQA